MEKTKIMVEAMVQIPMEVDSDIADNRIAIEEILADQLRFWCDYLEVWSIEPRK